MSRRMEKRKGSVLPADGLQSEDDQKMYWSGKKLRIHAVFSAPYMIR